MMRHVLVKVLYTLIILKKGIPNEHLDKVGVVLEALVKQGICGKKKKNMDGNIS